MSEFTTGKYCSELVQSEDLAKGCLGLTTSKAEVAKLNNMWIYIHKNRIVEDLISYVILTANPWFSATM